jgi:hypothetical protein
MEEVGKNFVKKISETYHMSLKPIGWFSIEWMPGKFYNLSPENRAFFNIEKKNRFDDSFWMTMSTFCRKSGHLVSNPPLPLDIVKLEVATSWKVRRYGGHIFNLALLYDQSHSVQVMMSEVTMKKPKSWNQIIPHCLYYVSLNDTALWQLLVDHLIVSEIVQGIKVGNGSLIHKRWNQIAENKSATILIRDEIVYLRDQHPLSSSHPRILYVY